MAFWLHYLILLLLLPLFSAANLTFKMITTTADSGSLSTPSHRRRLLDAYNLRPFGLRGGISFIEITLGGNLYRPQLDTMSEMIWFYCQGCTSCPDTTRSGYLYEVGANAKNVSCLDSFCSDVIQHGEMTCADEKHLCMYNYLIGADGSGSKGYMVNDTAEIGYLRGGGKGSPAVRRINLAVGCGISQSGSFMLDEMPIDGVFGLGHTASAFVPQVAAQTGIKNTFTHCLDKGREEGGLFAIGDFSMPPATTDTTSFDPDSDGYTLRLTGVEVAGMPVPLPWSTKPSSITRIVEVDLGSDTGFIHEDDFPAVKQTIFGKHTVIDFKGNSCIYIEEGGYLDLLKTLPNLTFVLHKDARWTLTPTSYMWAPNCSEPQCNIVACLNFLDTDRYIFSVPHLTNRVVSYDLEENTVTWTKELYDCYSAMDVGSVSVKYDGNYSVVEDIDTGSGAGRLLGRGRSEVLMSLLLLMFTSVFYLTTA